MELINNLAEQYALQYSSNDDILLNEILDYTTTNHAEAHMISGALQGQFLQLVSHIAQPQYILEIGTFTGYGALCLVKGLSKNGKLHTIELRENDAKIALSFFNKSAYHKHIELHVGNALDIIPTLKHQWDIVFIDADKVNYSNYYDLILPNVKKNGLILVDNVLFHGQVLETEIKGKNAIAIHAFNQKIKEDQSVQKVMLTLRDGLMLILKK
jgi:predicted O-methyltransferase YrrM